ncbi:MAG: hypothetical protein ASARMPRED_006702 [Alectoria sarmentosa]|nr:MAG: hypothetical protein ASARMPRED_006702 [Alectoria sarmentosa]
MSVNHSPTAEEPGPPQDLEGQTPGNSTDRVHAFQQPSQDEKPKNPNLVTLDGPDDPANPKNWPINKKWGATLIISAFSFISPLTSSMVGPALGQMAADLHMTNTVEIEISLSIFVLAWAVGPFFLGPLSEVYGRVRVLQISNLFFLAWNIGCGFAQNNVEIIVFRLLAGLGGSAQLAAGGGVLSDCWLPEQRGKAMGIYTLAPVLGPAIGPVLGGWIAERSTWRWVFWSTSIADAVVQVAGVFFLPETYTPTILKQKAKQLRRETGNKRLHTEFEDKKFSKLLAVALVRPFRLIGTQPIVQVLALYMAYLFGLFYLLFTTFSNLFEDVYHESVGIASLNYLALGLGFVLGGQINTHLCDRIYRRLKAKNNGVGKPEFRVPLMIPASCLIPVGLFWYGWSAQAAIHWIMPNIGVFIFGIGAILCLQCAQTYIIDSYQRYAASAMAAAVVLRSIAGFAFPIFAPYMYHKLHYGWGNTVLALAGVVIGIPTPVMLWYFGERIRKASPYASG